MSTNFYLHSTDFPESVHIGSSSGRTWTTDASVGLRMPGDDQPRGWTDTASLLVYLDAQERRVLRFPPWVADEDGRAGTPAQAAAIIRRHTVHRALDREFS